MPGNIINLKPEEVAKWPKPNYVNPPYRAWMSGYAGTLYALATVTCLIRLGTRARKRTGGFGIDDAFLVVGWVSYTVFMVVGLICIEDYHGNRHIWDVPWEFYEPIAKAAWIAEFTFLTTGLFVKTSVLLFFRRLVKGTCSRPWFWACVLAILFTFMWTLSMMLALIFNCNPTEAYWKAFSLTWRGHYTCKNTVVNNLLAGILSCVSDLYSVALPCCIMWNLQLPSAQKLGLYAVFCVGLIIVAASAVRTYYLWETGRRSDVSWYLFNTFTWAHLELSLGFACASAPSFRAFFLAHVSKPLTRFQSSLPPIPSFSTTLRSLTLHSTTTESATHRTGRRRGDSDVELVITKFDSPYDHVRSDFSARNPRRRSGTFTTTTTTTSTLVPTDGPDDDPESPGSDHVTIHPPLHPPEPVAQRPGGADPRVLSPMEERDLILEAYDRRRWDPQQF